MDFTKLLEYLRQTILPVSIIIATVLAGYIIRGIMLARIARPSDNKLNIGRQFANIIRGPMIVWFWMLGIYIALETSPVPKDVVQLAGKILLALGILSITMVGVNLSTSLIARHSNKIEGILPITSLTQNIARIIIFGIGILIILHTVGISIAPILATLGVGGLAVALALQDTLSNIFAGFYIIISRQLRVGDYVRLDSGEEGYITDITWRATQIRALPNNIILIPNEKLTKAICTNYYLPEKELSCPVQVGVHYSSDLEKVEKITCEVGREVMKQVPGGVENFEPFIRFHTFGDSSINFSVILRAKEFKDQYLIKHEFIKRLHKRYAQEGITIPYPIRAINFTQEKAEKEKSTASGFPLPRE